VTHDRLTRYLWSRIPLLVAFIAGAWLWGGWTGAAIGVLCFLAANWALALGLAWRSGRNKRDRS
jgi:hypothetical protein